MTADFKGIGKRIRSHRIQRHMTQAVLADRTGVSSVYISCIERGKKKVSLEVLLRIVDVFSISMDSLVLDEASIHLPHAYKKLTHLLSDCFFASNIDRNCKSSRPLSLFTNHSACCENRCPHKSSSSPLLAKATPSSV